MKPVSLACIAIVESFLLARLYSYIESYKCVNRGQRKFETKTPAKVMKIKAVILYLSSYLLSKKSISALDVIYNK